MAQNIITENANDVEVVAWRWNGGYRVAQRTYVDGFPRTGEAFATLIKNTQFPRSKEWRLVLDAAGAPTGHPTLRSALWAATKHVPA